ncbi:MAG: acyl carrier protein [Firmicutes bacterium]|nr:acyl carrier protein [Bacillota bacterium]
MNFLLSILLYPLYFHQVNIISILKHSIPVIHTVSALRSIVFIDNICLFGYNTLEKVPCTLRERKEGTIVVFEKIRDLIAEQLDIDPELIKPETDLMLDLNADSLDAVDVLTQIEDEFGIEIPDEKTEEFNIVANLVKYVEDHIEE